MLPLTLLAVQKISDLLTGASALQQEVAAISSSCNLTIPPLDAANVLLSSASQEMNDRDVQLAYPRICLYTSQIKNEQLEKFRSLSGSLTVTADVWASGSFITDINQWIHFYVEAFTNILRKNIGDWGDGVFFTGAYDVHFQPSKIGGLGFVQVARVSFILNVSRN